MIFKGLSFQRIKQIFLEGESPTLKPVEVKIIRNRNPGGKEGSKKTINEVRKHINILEGHYRR